MEIKDYCDIHGESVYVGDYAVIKRYGQPVAEGFIHSIYNDLVTFKTSESGTVSFMMTGDDVIEVTKRYEKPDMVNHPPHYQSENGIEVIDVIEAFTSDLKGGEATNTGNVIKYILRWPHKKNPLEDLKKARWYLDRLINLVEKRMKKENA